MKPVNEAILYIVATPLGNLEDISLRALKVLEEVNLIACEDTRQTKKLLSRFELKTLTVSYHQHSKVTKIDYLLGELGQGKSIALVSDAGTPGISDPGNLLVKEVVAQGFKVVPIPGPSAVTTAASVAGLPTDKFLFLGFPPHKKAREKFFKRVAACEEVVIFYESPHRFLKSLEQLAKFAAKESQIVICRELTKVYEEIWRGSLGEAIEYFNTKQPKGEYTIVFKNN